MGSDDSKPPNTQHRKGRWFWEPPAKLRALLNVKSRPLGGDQVLAWSMARKLNAELALLHAGGKPPGTVEWVFERFFETEKFKGLADSTQTDYRWLAKRIGRVKMGERDLKLFIAKGIKARHADAIVATISTESGHSTAHYCARFARRVWKWAARQDFVDQDYNPWAGMELKGLAERDQVWTAEQVASVIAAAEEAGKRSIGLAVRMAYSFGHRKNDILTTTWTAYDSGLRQTNKTGVTLPTYAGAYPDLDAAVEAERVRQKASDNPSTHVIVCEMTKRPWQEDVFAHHFRTIANAACLPSALQFRDLRATAATEMSDGGASVIEMSTHTGHKDMKMARRYARRTVEQFQQAAAKRQAGKDRQNEAKTASEPVRNFGKVADGGSKND